jgi:kinesin family protein 2/24
MSTSESDILKQYQTQELMIKRSSIVTRQIMRPVVDRRRSSAPCQEDNAPMLGHYSSAATKSTSSNTPPIVQGFNESDSWAMQIENLREDNDAEYNLFRDQVNYEQQHYFDMRIKVIVRKRPMSKSEADRAGGVDIIHPLDYGEFGKILVYQPKTRVDLTKEVETIPFAYDNVYGEESTNHQIYTRSLRNLIRPFLDGQWATCFAYGQTGSGKTYTMMGSNLTGINAGTASKDDSNLGLYYLAALEIFELLKEHQYYHLSLQVSLFEIYGGGKLYDLLNKREVIKCLENSHGKVCFPGLTQHPVHSPTEVMKLIEHGAENRSTGTTSRNADSSRSHAVLQLKLMKKIGRKADVEHSRFSFIDLAGSERGADTSNASKATRLEGADINTSLLALKEVIRALATGGSLTHIPFRGSKLTQVLKDSFVGENARCCMIACISPDIGNCEQTLNTLRYADRVKERNPENGALASSCEQPTRVVDMAQDVVTMTSDWKNVIRVNQPVHKVSSVETNRNDAQQLVTTAGLQLVADHKEVTKTWLEMLKSEAELIQAATDEEGWQAYYDQFEAYQSTEFDFLSKLREVSFFVMSDYFKGNVI